MKNRFVYWGMVGAALSLLSFIGDSATLDRSGAVKPRPSASVGFQYAGATLLGKPSGSVRPSRADWLPTASKQSVTRFERDHSIAVTKLQNAGQIYKL